jgi:hypothetical protein
MSSIERLDWCMKHPADPAECNCPAWLVAMGCMDMLIERQLETDPTFGAVLRARLNSNDKGAL